MVAMGGFQASQLVVALEARTLALPSAEKRAGIHEAAVKPSPP